MKKRIIIITFAAAALMSLITFEKACAYWIWTPETKKFVNPKYAVKDSPKEQFDWAMNFYQAKDYQKAAQEFEKLTKQYEYSEYASKAQYYVGLCYENMNKLYFAFQNYQKAIDNFPHIENMEEIIAREFNIANIYEDKTSPKVLGTDIMTSTDRAVEIYKKVVDNAPFGRLADESQFRMGQAFKKADRFDEAIPAFQKILDDYPNSQFTDKAKFEVADCAYKASLKPAYDIESTDKAIKAFEDFGQANRDEKLSGEAAKTIQRLKDKAAEKSFITAQFYESQRHYESAIIYYKDVVARFPDSSIAVKARTKIEDLGNRGRKNAQSNTGKEGQKKSWMPFSIPKKPKIPKSATVGEDVKSQKKSWQFFKFAKPAKKEKPEDTSVPKPEKPKGWWNPLKFTSKPKEEKFVQPTDSARQEKKGWSPFSFTKKQKPSEPAAIKEEAESQLTETEAVKETPVHAEATPPETETAEAKQTEDQTKAANTQETVAAPETVATQESATTTQETTTPATEMKAESGLLVEPDVVKEETKTPKKGWAPLSFTKPAKKGKPEKSKGWWNPVKFTSQPKPKKEKAVPIAASSSNEEKKGWSPFSFTKKQKPSEPAVAKEETKTPNKGWTPFSFTKPAKKEKPEDTSVPKPEKPKGWWNPLKFTSKPKEEKFVQPTDSARQEKKGWSPFSFTKKQKPSEPAAIKEEAESQLTETEAVKETPVHAEATPPETETAEAKQTEDQTKAEPAVEQIEEKASTPETVATQETVIIQDDVVIRKAQ